MIIPVKTASGGYDIILQRGALKCADQYLNLNRRVLIVTDNGVPAEYARSVASLCAAPLVLTIWQGEQSKSIDSWTLILKKLSENGFTRSDCVVAVGGGVVGIGFSRKNEHFSDYRCSAYNRWRNVWRISEKELKKSLQLYKKYAIIFRN